MNPRLICTDLDRTLLPNGDADESPGARALFTRAVGRPSLRLAYVTGRHRDAVESAIGEYGVPRPDFAICDVGTTIYEGSGGAWTELGSWTDQLSAVWPEGFAEQAREALAGIVELSLQAPENQARFKLSYFAPPVTNPAALLQVVRRNLQTRDLGAQAIYSVDDTAGIGLLDLLPPGSGKLGAIEHLLATTGIRPEQTLFAGDSGNDLEVLASAVPSVLVANAADGVRREALRRARDSGNIDRLLVARGGTAGLNGNYAAGILEGLVHFWPSTAEWLR